MLLLLLLLGIRSLSFRAQCPSRHFKIMSTCCGTWGSRRRAAKCTRLIPSIFHQKISTLILKVGSLVLAGSWSRYSRPIDWRVCNSWRRTRFSHSLRVFQSLKNSLLLPIISGLSGRLMLVPISSFVIFDKSSKSFNCRNIGSGSVFKILSWLR